MHWTASQTNAVCTIRKRLDDHLSAISRKAERLDREIAEIDWVVTGSELYAAILESYEIKRLQPSINRAQRARQLRYAVRMDATEDGYLRLSVQQAREQEEVLPRFSGKTAAFSALAAAVRRFDLCRNLSIDFHPGKPCFEYQVGACHGACCSLESSDAYNERVQLAASYLGQDLEGSFYLLDAGPEPHTRSVFAIEEGRFRGMGVLGPEDGAGLAALDTAIRSYPDNPDVRRLLRQYMARHRYERVDIPRTDDFASA
jgi:DNA polymerase III subunit epsilon